MFISILLFINENVVGVEKKKLLIPGRSLAASGSARGAPYLKSQNKWPFFNRKSSFFRGNSPFFLHFQNENSKRKWH